MAAAPAALLDPGHIAMLAKGISAIVASRNAALRPSVMRAMGSHIRPDASLVTVFLRRSQSAQLLHDIESTGQIAVVFSEPFTHRTLQLKAPWARVRAAEPGDLPLLQDYRHSMQEEVGRVGYGPAYVAAMLSAPLDDLVAVEFTPTAAFDQTPGPRAGRPVEPARP